MPMIWIPDHGDKEESGNSSIFLERKPFPSVFPSMRNTFGKVSSEYGAAWLARSSGGREVAGSNPAIPTIFPLFITNPYVSYEDIGA